MRHKLIISLIFSLILTFPITELNAQRRSRAHHAHHVSAKHTKKVVRKHGRYVSLPRWGTRVRRLDANAHFFKHKKDRYYYQSGVFYHKTFNKYRIVKAPVGIRVNAVPAATVKLLVRHRPYYYYYGTFYKKREDGAYETVNAPTGALIEDLPEGVEQVEVNGETVYKIEDVFYKPVENANGVEQYKVIDVE